MRCGESVLALVALWCADKRLLFSLLCPVIALSIVMTSHVWLKRKDCPHCVARVRGAFAKLGSGVMGSRFREQLTHSTDPAVFTQPDQWKDSHRRW